MGKLVDRKEKWKYDNKNRVFKVEIVTHREIGIDEAIDLYKRTKASLKDLRATKKYYKWFVGAVKREMQGAPAPIRERLKSELENMELAVEDVEERIKRSKEALEIFKEHEDILKQAEKERDSKSVG